MKPDCGMTRAQGEISKAAEARAMTAMESNRAFSDSMGDQGHPGESKEGAEHCSWKKTKGGESKVNIDTCSKAGEVSTGQWFLGTGFVDRDGWQDVGSSWGTWSTAPQVPICQAQEDTSAKGQRETRRGVVAGSLWGWRGGLLFQ